MFQEDFKFLYEYIEEYKETNDQDIKMQIYNEFCNRIWSSDNKRRVYQKNITFYVRHNLLHTELGKIFDTWSSIPYSSYKMETKDNSFDSIIRQKVNNLYTNYFDSKVCLKTEYMDLIKTPKHLYHKWINGKEFTADEITEMIDEAFYQSNLVKEKYALQKMTLSWEEYKKLINEFFLRIFNNCKIFEDSYYEDKNLFILSEFWIEDNYYTSYFCDSLNLYMRNYQKKYYGLYVPNSKQTSYLLKRCERCGALYQNKHFNQKYCKNCTSYKKKSHREVKCIDCSQVFRIPSYNRKSNRCVDCYKKYRKQYKLRISKNRKISKHATTMKD